MRRALSTSRRAIELLTALAGALTLCACAAFGETEPNPLGRDAEAPGPEGGAAAPDPTGRPLGVQGDVTATDGDTTSLLGFAAPDDNGAAITSYEYDVNADDTWRALGADRVVLGLTNGTTYKFRVRAVNAKGPSATPSAQSNAVVPYGAPEPPKVTASLSAVTVTWAWTPASASGRAVIGYQVKLDGGAYGATAAKASFSKAFSDAVTHSLCVVAITDGDAARNRSGESCTPVPWPYHVAKAEITADGFTTAVAGGSVYNNESVAGTTYSIAGACFTSTDIGSNNGYWYKLAATGHWVAATTYVQKKNEFGAPRISGGGGGCN